MLKKPRNGIKKKMLDVPISQIELALDSGIAKTTLNYLVNGRCNYTNEEAKAIASVLDCEIQDVLNDFKE